MSRRPETLRNGRRDQRGPGWVRALVAAIFLAVTGMLTWLGLRRSARRPSEETEQQRRADLPARLRRRGHEPNPADVGAIVGLGVVFVVLVGVLSIGSWGLFNAFTGARPAPQAASAPLNAPL